MKRRFRIESAAVLVAAFLFLASCHNPLMNAVIAKVASDQAKTIGVFGFAAANNAKLYVDVNGIPDSSGHNISIQVPKWVPLNTLVATFQFQGKSIMVGNTPQVSGVTPNDFTNPVTYVVTPASGTPVKYTITATVGSQGLMGGVIQGTPLSLSGTVSTIAGTASPFGGPQGMAQIGSTIYVADSSYNVIWQVDANTHICSVFAGMLSQPGYLDAPSGPGTSAQFDGPTGLATDGTNLYVADYHNFVIRRISLSSGAVTTLAGQGPTSGGTTDGSPGKFYYPAGLYYDPVSTLLFESSEDTVSRTIRTITTPVTPPGTVTTVFNYGVSAGPLSMPYDLLVWTPTSTTNSYTDPDVTNGTLCYYEVAAITSGVQSATSQQQSALPQPVVSGAPTGFSAKPGNSIVNLSWSAYSGATGYNVYWSTISGVTTSGTKIALGNVTSYSFSTGVTNGQSYYFIVTAVAGAETTACAQQSATPYSAATGVPANLKAVAGNGVITLSWSAVSGATSYVIYRSSASGTGTYANLSNLFVADTTYGTTNTNQIFQFGLWNGYPAAPTTTNCITLPSAGNNYFDSGNPQYNSPDGLAFFDNFLFVVDRGNNSIQKVDPTQSGSGALYAGGGSSTAKGHVDGTGGSAIRFNSPTRIITSGSTMYVAESGNLDIRAIASLSGVSSSGIKSSTLAGVWPDSVDGNGAAARFYNPRALTTNGSSLWIADQNNDTLRSVGLTSPYTVSTVAGQAGVSSEANGTGPAATFNGIGFTTTDGKYVYISDESGSVIRRFNIATGVVDTIAGVPNSTGYLDGPGSQALFGDPKGITTDGVNLYVVDNAYNSIREISLSSPFKVSTIAGPGASGTAGYTNSAIGASALFDDPLQITTDGTNLYLTCGYSLNSSGSDIGNEAIREISLTAPYAVTTVAGAPAGTSGQHGYVNASGTNALFYNPTGITTDGTNLYVSDNDNYVIRMISISNGNVTTLAGNNSVYVTGSSTNILVCQGEQDNSGTNARFHSPNGVSTDGKYLYVLDSGSSVLRMIH